MKLPIAIASLAFTVQASQAAEPIAVRVTNGLPQLSQVDGRAFAWRYLTVRADTSIFGFEARLSDCIAATRVTSGSSSGARPTSCSGSDSAPAAEQVSQQLRARIRTPQLFDGAPKLELALRNWRTTSRSATASLSKGSSAEAELSQPIGPVMAFTGVTVPFGRVTPSDDWRTRYAGLKWSPLARHSIEVSNDWSRQARSATFERESTLEYSYARTQDLRWRLFATRALDSSTEPWRSGLGLDWTF